MTDGAVLEVAKWLPTLTEGEVHALRPKLRSDQPEIRFTCFCCGYDVLMRKHSHGGHFFAHKEKNAADKVSCLYQQARGLSHADLDRLRYHGQREGSRHIRTKHLIARILRADHRFAEPDIEETWTSFLDGWRKPDVASKIDNMPVVFEAQVSNTYPQVVADRTDFYRKRGALLMWIFDQLPDAHWHTLHADAFCSNSQHIFLVDEECATVSEDTGKAHFRIYSQRPGVEPFRRPTDGRVVLRLIQEESQALVPFENLSLDAKLQTATLFDAAEEGRRARHKVLCAEAQADSFQGHLENDLKEWLQSSKSIDRKNVEGWAALVCAIESRRLARPVGTGLANQNAAGVLNLVYDHHPAFFSHLVRMLDGLNLDPPENRRGAWRTRVEEFHAGRYKNGPVPQPHRGSEKLLTWLYSSSRGSRGMK